jgi:dTDP-glucose 4,6-dehydratase
MKVLVTGGAGFIGSHFVEWTLKNRPEVDLIVLDKLTYASVVGRETLDLLGVPLIVGDIANPEDVDRATKNIDVIVNFAAETHNDNSIESPDVFYRTNVLGTLELAKVANSRGIRFHQISTDEVFGDLAIGSEEKFTRESAYNPSSPYSASKAAADHVVRAWTRTYGLRATISNCSNNYGPRQHVEKLIPKSIALLAQGRNPVLYGDGENVRDWIHVLDHVRGIWAVLDRGSLGETYLLGANCERSNKEVTQTLIDTSGLADVEIEFISDRPGHDRRYAIDSTQSQAELSWSPQIKDFEAELGKILSMGLRLATPDE